MRLSLQGHILNKLLGQSGNTNGVDVGSPPKMHLPPGPALDSPTRQKASETGVGPSAYRGHGLLLLQPARCLL